MDSWARIQVAATRTARAVVALPSTVRFPEFGWPSHVRETGFLRRLRKVPKTNDFFFALFRNICLEGQVSQ